jgi:hypothetical protein
MGVVTGTGGAWERSGVLRTPRRHLLERIVAATMAGLERLLMLLPGRDATTALEIAVDESMRALARRILINWKRGWPSG